MLKSKAGIITIILLSLPILLHVYNPSMKLGGFGLLLGGIGYFVSPIVIFGTLFYLLYQSFQNKQ